MENHTLIKREGAIVILGFRKKGVAVDLVLAKELVEKRLEYYNGQSYPTLADIRPVKLFTKEARDYLAKEDAIRGISAGAILIGNHFTVQIANLYMRFSKPTMPTRAFRTKEQAVKWLNQFAKH